MTVWSAAVLLFFVLDPVGNVPLFVSALARVEPRRRNRVLLRELLLALVALLLFLGAGGVAVRALSVSRPALSISGGVILLLIALHMVFASGKWLVGEESDEPFIVPLAIPLVAGPSALATVLLLVAREPAGTVRCLVALVVAWAGASAILLLSAPLSRALGPRGLTALERLMGMLLTAVAVQMLLEGVNGFLDGRR